MEKYVIELKIDNRQQEVKLDVEFLPENQLARNEVKLTIRSVSGRQVTATIEMFICNSTGFVLVFRGFIPQY